MLSISNLHARVGNKEILRGVDLTIGAGEVHVVMGPNGSGKSTLSAVLAGSPEYDVMAGSVTFAGQDLLAQSIEQRAQAGLFLGFQYPVEIPGLTMVNFLKSALNARRTARGEGELDAMEVVQLLRAKLALLGLPESLLSRGVNEGMSGGEKKKSEMYQLAVLEPQLAILDEIDSGLDVDALRVVGQSIEKLRTPERSFLLITHYERLLDYVRPDCVHIFHAGRIVKSGGPELVQEIEKKGYESFTASAS